MTPYRGTIFLIISSLVWGIAFVPQRIASAHIEANTFNAIKYLGATVLMTALFGARIKLNLSINLVRQTLTLGALLFAGSYLQQRGVASTTAGKAGFITGLYMAITPILLITFWRTSVSLSVWLGALSALVGLSLLSVNNDLSVVGGDLLVFLSAFMFALQIIYGDRFVHSSDAVALATGQYLFCGIFSALALAIFETPTLNGVYSALPSLGYMIIFSTGIGYTLALIGQRYVLPEIAGIILGLEAVFAAIAGWLLLDEALNQRQLIGCGLMLLGCYLAQVGDRDRDQNRGGRG
jgi:drug/metabolite transporter (DMT)-like permease